MIYIYIISAIIVIIDAIIYHKHYTKEMEDKEAFELDTKEAISNWYYVVLAFVVLLPIVNTGKAILSIQHFIEDLKEL